ncbi:MAG TPA: NTP transferase domain-containing protein [Actinomycetota bacterium]|jgi:choline kinase/phosphatidylglycerophosphate synthase|nr:NTP transferase domain-containing protein [Actinomycetota bacterium]
MAKTVSERDPLDGRRQDGSTSVGARRTTPLLGSPGLPTVGVMLAAGRSERLAGVTGGGSKALIRLGGLSLVERAVRELFAVGLERILVVVGYHAGPVATVVDRLAPGRVTTVPAERWELGNGASLAAAEPYLEGEPLFVVVTADHVFGEGALSRLVHARRPAALIDPSPDYDVWAEGTKVRVQDGMALAFSKEFDEQSVDCGAFVLTPAIFDAQRLAEREGDLSLAGAVSCLATSQPMATIDIPTESWWHDVDTPDDLAIARTRLRRSLVKKADGPVARYLNRPISTRISMAIAPLRLHPDLLSLAALMMGLVAAWLFATGRGVAGGIAAHAASVLDGVDGEAARLQVRAGPKGALLDGVMDRLADAAILAGLGIWALDGSPDPAVIVGLTVAATTGAMLSMATKDRITALGLPPRPERRLGYLLGGRDGRMLLVAVGGILGSPVGALTAVVATSALSLAVRLVSYRSR